VKHHNAGLRRHGSKRPGFPIYRVAIKEATLSATDNELLKNLEFAAKSNERIYLNPKSILRIDAILQDWPPASDTVLQTPASR
jgi:hypothetical protein